MAHPQTLARTAFPEREDRDLLLPDQWALGLLHAWRRLWGWRVQTELGYFARNLPGSVTELGRLGEAELRERLRQQARLAWQANDPQALRRALLLVAEASHRALGMRPFPTQLAGAAVLARGRLAEMQTGEGKTLTAGLAACVLGCAGLPVHVVTVNDYLAERDAEKIGPLYRLAQLSVGVAQHGISPEAKRAAYASDITYCTGKELVFDYLRDRVAARGRATAAQMLARNLLGDAPREPTLRGLHFAIVDEVDSILIDEARTPLILAERAGPVDHAQAMPQALALARRLQPGQDFLVVPARRELSLTRRGREQVAELTRGWPEPWPAQHVREHLAHQALQALHLFERDKQYLIDPEGAVQIIDEYTGRVLPGRTWEQGLHQMIECKEGVALSERTQTLARITYQRFFARYLHMAGMTGTAREMARELAVVYGLHTVTLPTHRPSRRRWLPERVLPDEAAKWQAVAEEARQRQQRGQPVLIGTRSVLASETLSTALTRLGVAHQVLNARQDAAEAEMVAQAGQRGAVTVATNMAGRGTDISLGDGVEALGGLCVILTEYHESPRIDRQLVGRCARQGQPGECLALTALDDELLQRQGGWQGRLLDLLARRWGHTPVALQTWCRRAAQARAEAMHARTRRDTLSQDRQLERTMAYSGTPI